MEKLQIKHTAPYLPYGLKCQCRDLGILELTSISTINKDYQCWFESALDYANRDFNYNILSQNGQCGIGFNLDKVKPVLKPLSDLYKEIDGKVGIVDLAKMHDPDFDDTEDVTVTPLTGWSTMGHVDYWNNDGIECRFGWFNSFQAGYINPTRHRFVSNQLDLFTYLFQHHYDVYSLIDKGLAIDLNSISHE